MAKPIISRMLRESERERERERESMVDGHGGNCRIDTHLLFVLSSPATFRQHTCASIRYMRQLCFVECTGYEYRDVYMQECVLCICMYSDAIAYHIYVL